jgi:predicted dehydrogenase
MQKIHFGIVGYGNIGKRHAHHIINHKDALLDGIASLQEKPLDVTCNYYNTIEELLIQASEIDVVNVCTPNYLHCEHTIKCLDAGKHVVCEKPMAISTSECNSMIDAALKNNKKIFAVKQNRYNPPVQQVKKLLQENVFGKIFLININCFWNRNEQYYNESSWRGKKREDGGCLFTQFSHFIDILYYLFGNVVDIKGQVNNFNHLYTDVEDSGTFIMKTKEGALVNFNFSTCSYEQNMEGAITILAEHGTVKIGGQYLNTIEYQHIKNIELPMINITAKANDYGSYKGSMSNHDNVIDNVINTLHGTEEIMTNAQEGKDVVNIIERMYASI